LAVMLFSLAVGVKSVSNLLFFRHLLQNMEVLPSTMANGRDWRAAPSPSPSAASGDGNESGGANFWTSRSLPSVRSALAALTGGVVAARLTLPRQTTHFPSNQQPQPLTLEYHE
jgi:hypothetical protein